MPQQIGEFVFVGLQPSSARSASSTFSSGHVISVEHVVVLTIGLIVGWLIQCRRTVERIYRRRQGSFDFQVLHRRLNEMQLQTNSVYNESIKMNTFSLWSHIYARSGELASANVLYSRQTLSI